MLNPRYPPAFPPLWASAWGDDRYGLWAEFELGGSIQRLRWIEPGEFLMGSPDDEPEHWAQTEGPQHRVRLSAGFWLADTACTQALWLAVLGGENPSAFKDDLTCPVEQVSADDAEVFLTRLCVALGDDARAMLPTEAQWEYACRAGTTTPFSFGANITPEKVNYNGNYPYAGSAKGPYRERSVPVKSLPSNPWGLYEMHGNVWEWCADDRRLYRALALGQAELDPQGALDSADRSLRGGAWFNRAGYARCACRNLIARVNRYHNLGFRFSLGS